MSARRSLETTTTAMPASRSCWRTSFGPMDVSVSITVVAADGAADPGGAGGAGGADSLPRTGDDASIPLAKVGLALAAIGGVVTAVAAKRRKASAVTA